LRSAITFFVLTIFSNQAVNGKISFTTCSSTNCKDNCETIEIEPFECSKSHASTICVDKFPYLTAVEVRMYVDEACTQLDLIALSEIPGNGSCEKGKIYTCDDEYIEYSCNDDCTNCNVSQRYESTLLFILFLFFFFFSPVIASECHS